MARSAREILESMGQTEELAEVNDFMRAHRNAVRGLSVLSEGEKNHFISYVDDYKCTRALAELSEKRYNEIVARNKEIQADLKSVWVSERKKSELRRELSQNAQEMGTYSNYYINCCKKVDRMNPEAERITNVIIREVNKMRQKNTGGRK